MTSILFDKSLRYPLTLSALIAPGLTLCLPTAASARAVLQSVAPTPGASGVLDAVALFNLLAVTLVELGAIFWVGAQLWVNFISQSSAERHSEEQALNSRVEARFEKYFSLPTLALLLLANCAVLYGQLLPLTGNDWGAAFNWQLLSEHATNGSFGASWLLRMGTLLLALLVGIYMLTGKRHLRVVNQALPLVNLALGMLLLIAIALSSQVTPSNALQPYSVVIGWVQYVAAALWIGGLLYLLLVYLPLLWARPAGERTRSLLAVLAYYLPLALLGALLLIIVSVLDAKFQLASLDQLTSTAYGRVLLVKLVLMLVLFAVTAYHNYWLRPRLAREYHKYTYASERLARTQTGAPDQGGVLAEEGQLAHAPALLVQQVKLREGRLAKKATLMTRGLAWAPWLGVAIVVCLGLMNVFAGTLTSIPAQQPGPVKVVAGPFHATQLSSDGKYRMTLSVTPNTFGTNVFTVQIIDVATGQPVGAHEGEVTLFTTMLDMAMGTDSVTLQPDGKGGFSASGDLSMNGNWSVTIQLRTPDHVSHSAQFKFYTPF